MPKVAVLFLLLCAIFASRANASAWMLNKGEVKAIAKYNYYSAEERVPAILLRNILTAENIVGKVHASDSEIFIEYGAAKKLTTTLKYTYGRTRADGEFTQAGGASRSALITKYETELLEITARTPLKYNLGLLPPFTKKIVERIAKFAKVKERVRRDKVGTAGLYFIHNGDSGEVGYGLGLAQGDKLSIGRWSILQEAQYQEIRFNSAKWRRSLYKAEIGYGSTHIGQEVDNFEDRKSNYKSKTEFYYVGYDIKTLPIAMRFGRGTQRRPIRIDRETIGLHIPTLTESALALLPQEIILPVDVDMWRFELQVKF